ncbi:hypothetical protein HZH68_003738 [Vespula germanica]|uniref:Uncharacterized protein n=3 Tax=Vespula TaxID=7451 RepID=A0A834NPP0_VESGE|nr:hypothetical protein HZH66_003349 [Vespula vulgaris]KAF7415249.1 hypothetical protein HZH68_003738 [Vespula germanica]
MPRNWKSLNASKKKEKEEAEKKSVLRKSSRSSREQPTRSKEEGRSLARRCLENRPFFFDSSTEGQSSGTVFPDAPSMPKSFGAKDSKLPEREKSLERLEPLEIGRYAAS